VPSRSVDRGTLGRARATAIAAAGVAIVAILASTAAHSDAFYKWTDKDGKVQYSDAPPKNAPGEVTRVEIDPTTNATHLPAPARNDAAAAAVEDKGTDMAAKRRALRAALEADVERARAKLERAKAALAGAVPEDSERQVIQQRSDSGNPRPGPGSSATGGMLGSGGMYGNAAKSNCRTVTGSDGKSVVTCATVVPGEAYYDRIEKLEEAVRDAAEELSAAEQAYRRGVD
jgi:hypothetical protein